MAQVDNIFLQKHYGQHFLKDKAIVEKIISEISAIENTMPLLEIGPGAGVLTEKLIQLDNYKAVDVDPRWVEYLHQKYPEKKSQIIHQDILQADWLKFFDRNFGVIGNFPYNISSQILFRILEHKEKVDVVVGMFQKEVAQRVYADHGNKQYGILSVLIQAHYDVIHLFDVSPGSFHPPPKVMSSVIRMNKKENVQLDCDERLFNILVKQAFNQRRKTLRNSLKSRIKNEKVKTLSIFDKRPEQLDVDAFINLTNIIDE